MLHARRNVALRRRVAPLLLIAVTTAALGGLVALPAAAPAETDVVRFAASGPGPELATVERARERAVERASRGRRIAQLEAEAEAARLAAEQAARVQAEAEAAARAKAEAEAAAAAKAAAEREAAAKAKAKAAQAAQAQAAPVTSGMACPVPAASFTDTWGAPRSGGRSHQGTDMLAPKGSPVYAIVSGRVDTTSSSLGGISLYLAGDNGERYFYAHNSANVAADGQRVEAGQLIAQVGSTGNAGGTNHVHFEREVDGRAVNPYDLLRRVC